MIATCVFIVHNVPSRTEIMSMTDTCFKTFASTVDRNFEFLVFDNGTKDEGQTFEFVKGFANLISGHNLCKRSEAIRHEKNEPISKCWNEAIEWAKGDVIVLVNNDVVFNKRGWLGVLTDTLFVDNIGAAGGRMLGWNNFVFLEGAFLSFKKDVALQVAENGKVFDEQFIFTCEEADFQRRLQNAGYTLHETEIENQGFVTHLHHQTLCWSNEDGGWDGVSILDVMHDSRRKLCRKYGMQEKVND